MIENQILNKVISSFDEKNKKYLNNSTRKMVLYKFRNMLKIVVSKVFEVLYKIKNVEIKKEKS